MDLEWRSFLYVKCLLLGSVHSIKLVKYQLKDSDIRIRPEFEVLKYV